MSNARNVATFRLIELSALRKLKRRTVRNNLIHTNGSPIFADIRSQAGPRRPSPPHRLNRQSDQPGNP